MIPARLKGSPLEVLLAFQMDALKWTYESQVKLIEGRRFTWDFVFRPQKIAVEVQGGIWRAKGAHNTGTAILRDCEKANLAALQGYRTIFVTAEHIKDGRAIEWLRKALQWS